MHSPRDETVALHMTDGLPEYFWLIPALRPLSRVKRSMSFSAQSSTISVVFGDTTDQVMHQSFYRKLILIHKDAVTIGSKIGTESNGRVEQQRRSRRGRA